MWQEIIRMGGALVFFVLIAVFIFVYVMSKQKERMVLIEKGVDITELNINKYGRYANLRNGILLISLAVGLISGYIVTIASTMNVFIAYAVLQIELSVHCLASIFFWLFDEYLS